jgi:hypothetical protein
MQEPIKVLVGPSPHYHQLKSGHIKYQKSKPAHPIWRILIIDGLKNVMHMRYFANRPSAEDIDRVVVGLLSSEQLNHSGVVIPATVERLCPGLQDKLTVSGAQVYLPSHGFASGAITGKESDRFLGGLEFSLNIVREAMASCEEIAVATDNSFGVVTTTLRLDDDKDVRKIDIAYKMAQTITRLRGRDPELGRRIRENETIWAPLNKGSHVPPPEDVLATLLDDLQYLHDPGVRDVILQLESIRDAEPEQKLSLVRELGSLAIIHQIAGIRRRRYDFLFKLNLHLRDRALRFLVSLGMKEAFKMLIVLDEGLLQVSAARVAINYPQECFDLSLRGIPAHHHLETMVQQLSGGKVAILPEFAQKNPGTPEFLKGWGPFSSPMFSDRTQLNPKQCLTPVTKKSDQKSEGVLIVLAILPKDTASYVPIEDEELADRMTEFVNERLSRSGRNITCRIMPLQTYGDLIEISHPPRDLEEVIGIDWPE